MGEGECLQRNDTLLEKSFSFAVRVVKLYRFLCEEKREYTLSKQLLRSGTSIGANVREAGHGQSKRGFLSKMSIALKEANESLYWIDLLYAAGYIDSIQKESIWVDCNELICLLVATVKTTKKRLEKESQ